MTADLIAKLESAEGPSRELDAEIGKILHPNPDDIGDLCSRYGDWPGPFTSSLDAALTLVPEGYWWTAGDCRREKHARVAPEAVDDDGHEAFSATVAIALCIAALRARGEG